MTVGIGTGLVARTVEIDTVDLVAAAGADGWLWEREGTGMAGRGAALRIESAAGPDEDAVLAALRSIPCDTPDRGPVAVAALPFDRDREASVVVPTVVFRREAGGRCWVTTVGPEDGGVPDTRVRAATPARDPDGFTLTSPLPHDEWMGLVARAVADIDRGRLEKVVLAREVRVDANRRIDIPTVLGRLRALYPACTVVSAPGGGGRFVAASPELLVSRHDRVVRSHPLAGTIPRSGDPDADAALAASLLASAKDRAEHAWVVRDVASTLAPWCASLQVPEAPSIVSLRNVSHLGTLVTGRLDYGAPSALGLAAALHPTAAVGGTPREPALAWIRAHERLERGPYAGPVGWVDAAGDGEWVVGIRSAVVSGSTARLFAGVGVVEGSDPSAELAETQFKLQALLAAVVRP